MSYSYFVQYGIDFNHLTELKVFDLYRDAVKYFEGLGRDLYGSAFLFKQNFESREGQTGLFACETVEYKKFYCEIKQNDRILEIMREGKKLVI